jgi:hypothetical protein
MLYECGGVGWSKRRFLPSPDRLAGRGVPFWGGPVVFAPPILLAQPHFTWGGSLHSYCPFGGEDVVCRAEGRGG